MLGHVLAALKAAGATRRRRRRRARSARTWRRKLQQALPEARIFVQRDRLGTAHAVLSAREALERKDGRRDRRYGDTPLVSFRKPSPSCARRLREGAAVVAMGFEAKDPTGYGRFIMSGDELLAIREHKDASEAERAITLCNGGLMAIRGDRGARASRPDRRTTTPRASTTSPTSSRSPASLGHRAAVAVVPEEEVHGVNDRAQLAARRADDPGAPAPRRHGCRA